MQMTKLCLAILVVAAMFMVSGCENLLGGPQNCEFGVQGWGCAPNPDAGGDGTYGGDGYSSPETNNAKPEVSKDVVDICASWRYLHGTQWTCNAGAAVAECVLVVIELDNGVCDVICPKFWEADATTLLFPSDGKLVYDLNMGEAPPAVPCTKKAN